MTNKVISLNQKQVDILELLYTYRFGSRQLIADSLKIKAGSSLHERLGVLIKYGLIAMRQDGRAKLDGIPAAYFLTPHGLRALQALENHDYITESVIKSSYRDTSVSQKFINHTFDIYTHMNLLQKGYPKLGVYLRREMSQYSYFPKTPPDAFISYKQDDTAHRFFVDSIPDTMTRKELDQRIAGYARFFNKGGWEATGSDLPRLLFIAEKPVTERRIRRTAQAVRYRMDILDGTEIYTTNYAALRNMVGAGAIWTNIDDPDEQLSLYEL